MNHHHPSNHYKIRNKDLVPASFISSRRAFIIDSVLMPISLTLSLRSLTPELILTAANIAVAGAVVATGIFAAVSISSGVNDLRLSVMKAETKAQLKGVQGSVQLLYLTVGLLVTAMVGPKVGLLEAAKTLSKAEAVLVQQNKEEVQGKKCIFGISST